MSQLLTKPLLIKKVAVLGAGVMGAQIAAHCINARVPVVLFDLPAKEGSKNSIVEKALQNLKKLNPAPLGDASQAALIQAANYETDLAQLQSCDLVIEAIAERMDWKHDLYKKVTPHLSAHTIFASNTSGLSINALSEGFSGELSAELKQRFCGVHFFNPPRYMHLVELIPTAHTRPEILDQLETFLTQTLGKGVVRALDTPNFIANRVGIFSILATVHEAEKFGLSYDLVDDLTGKKLGRAKSATFRTADVVGLDTLAHVIKTMQDTLPTDQDPFAASYATPPALKALIDQGALGQKTGAGFYKKVGKDILKFDAGQGSYVPGGAAADPLIDRILKKPVAERFKLLRDSSHPQAQFLWSIFRDVWHYSAVHLASVADNARDLDFAMRWGFGWNEGPFETWQAAGWKTVAQWIVDDIAAGKTLSSAPLPDWVFKVDGVHSAAGSYSVQHQVYLPTSELPVYARQHFRHSVLGADAPDALKAGTTLHEDESIRLWTLDQEILIASFKSKMNTIGPGVTAGVVKAVALAEQQFQGLVIWQPSSLSGGPFSAGADLQAMLPAFAQGGASAIEPFQKALQDMVLALRYAQVPTVAAVSGIALGGGCELALYCSQRVATFESYMGLVEIGVGLLPGAGGLTYLARQAAEKASEQAAQQPAAGNDSGDILSFLKKYFQNVAMATVGKSALENRAMAYLLPSDVLVMHSHELLHVALATAKAAYTQGYRPPLRTPFAALGRTGLATIKTTLVNMRDGGFITAHDYFIAAKIAEVMCGGEVEPGTLVDEATLMALERKHFGELIGHPKTQERITGLLQTGKPARN